MGVFYTSRCVGSVWQQLDGGDKLLDEVCWIYILYLL